MKKYILSFLGVTVGCLLIERFVTELHTPVGIVLLLVGVLLVLFSIYQVIKCGSYTPPKCCPKCGSATGMRECTNLLTTCVPLFRGVRFHLLGIHGSFYRPLIEYHCENCGFYGKYNDLKNTWK